LGETLANESNITTQVDAVLLDAPLQIAQALSVAGVGMNATTAPLADLVLEASPVARPVRISELTE
jgi:hypothetical protein